MTPNYFNNAKQNVPLVTDLQSMNEPKKTLRAHLRSVKRALGLKRDKPKPAVDYSELIVEAGPIRKASIDVQGEMVLRTANSLLGLAVVSHAGANHLGEVRDLIFCHESDEVLALVLEDHNNELGQTQIVPWSEICCVEKEKITVYRTVSKMSLSAYPRALHAASERESRLSGTQVLNAEGKYLRMLADMCIDETSGYVMGYEAPDGFIPDSLHGKKFLLAPPEAMASLK